jgi:hypothetical protein
MVHFAIIMHSFSHLVYCKDRIADVGQTADGDAKCLPAPFKTETAGGEPSIVIQNKIPSHECSVLNQSTDFSVRMWVHCCRRSHRRGRGLSTAAWLLAMRWRDTIPSLGIIGSVLSNLTIAFLIADGVHYDDQCVSIDCTKKSGVRFLWLKCVIVNFTITKMINGRSTSLVWHG